MDNINLDLNSLEETMERWFLELNFRQALDQNRAEMIAVSDSLDRVTAKPVMAVQSSPSFYAASADGIAVLSSKTYGANQHNPLKLRVGNDAFFVDAGSLMPENSDAVVPMEKVKFLSIEEVEITNYSAPWENVRPVGEDVAAKEVILPAHHLIRPMDIAAMIMGEVQEIEVVRKPRIGILPVGDTLVMAGAKPPSGKTVETSSHIISNTITKIGGEPVVLDIVPETFENIIEASSMAVSDIDLLVIIGGPSLGTRPVVDMLEKMGETVGYGVLVKPGMSSCFGILGSTPVVGTPGYAISTFLIFELFVEPVIYRKLGIPQPPRRKIRAHLLKHINSPKGVDEFIRVSLADVDGTAIAAPLSRGAHVLMSLVRADGLIRINAETGDVKAGEAVDVELLRPEIEINKKVLIAGSHDLSFDILRSELQKRYADIRMFSSTMGSMRGLMALKAGHCHISSIHLFDDETGDFNIPFVQKFLYDVPLILVNMFYRHLGFIVAKGNPKNITNFSDLARDDLKIINRIRGSGTRMVFDYFLKKEGVEINSVRGYSDEAHTHLNLASAVASGSADVGLGILEAARATGLDFIPLIPERLDFVVPKKFLKCHPVRCLLKVIASDDFKKEVKALGGYDVSSTGKVIFEK